MREIRLDLDADVARVRMKLAPEAGKISAPCRPRGAVLCRTEPLTPVHNFANFREYKLLSRLQCYCHVVVSVNLADLKGRR